MKSPFLTVIALLASASACTTIAPRLPKHAAPHELVLVDQGRLEIWEADQAIAVGPKYKGLEEYAQCVEPAVQHARKARRAGRAREALAWTGGSLGVASLGGLSGLFYLEHDPQRAAALVGGGLATAALALTLSGISRQQGHKANGNAIDAMNYYNDRVGFAGGHCEGRRAVFPEPEPLPLSEESGALPLTALRDDPSQG
jgi:hypothetical protein